MASSLNDHAAEPSTDTARGWFLHSAAGVSHEAAQIETLSELLARPRRDVSKTSALFSLVLERKAKMEEWLRQLESHGQQFLNDQGA